MSKPVVITAPIPLPLTTFEPFRQIFGILNTSSVSFPTFDAIFSIGMLSPVKADWLTNKSFESNNTKSAGTIEPAVRVTISPITTFSVFISISLSLFLNTVVLLFNFDLSFSLNLYVE